MYIDSYKDHGLLITAITLKVYGDKSLKAYLSNCFSLILFRYVFLCRVFCKKNIHMLYSSDVFYLFI